MAKPDQPKPGDPKPGNLVHSAELDWAIQERHGEEIFRRRSLGYAAGGRDIGCSQYDLPPGGKLWPYHFHYANEEAIYVLSGSGRIRLPDGEHPLAAGDYVALPPGRDSAHRVFAAEDEGLSVVIFSTMQQPEIAVYPDSGKLGLFAGSAPGALAANRDITLFIQPEEGVDYWKGED